MASEPSAGPERERAQVMEVARVERWRGYTTTTFVLHAADGTSWESTAFKWRRAAPPPDEGAARAAYDALVADLVADGWTQGDAGTIWYETSFERPREVPTDVPVSPAPAPAKAEPEPEPPPRPAPRLAPPPRPVTRIAEPAPSLRPTPRRRLRSIALVAAGACIGALGAFLVLGHDGRPATIVTHRVTTTATTTTATTTTPIARPHAPPAARPRKLVEVVIVGARANGSWLEARRGSQRGRLLYSGVVGPGQRVHLRGRVIWARFGAAGNVDITLDGHPVTLTGTYDKTFRPRR